MLQVIEICSETHFRW